MRPSSWSARSTSRSRASTPSPSGSRWSSARVFSLMFAQSSRMQGEYSVRGTAAEDDVYSGRGWCAARTMTAWLRRRRQRRRLGGRSRRSLTAASAALVATMSASASRTATASSRTTTRPRRRWPRASSMSIAAMNPARSTPQRKAGAPEAARDEADGGGRRGAGDADLPVRRPPRRSSRPAASPRRPRPCGRRRRRSAPRRRGRRPRVRRRRGTAPSRGRRSPEGRGPRRRRAARGRGPSPRAPPPPCTTCSPGGSKRRVEPAGVQRDAPRPRAQLEPPDEVVRGDVPAAGERAGGRDRIEDAGEDAAPGADGQARGQLGAERAAGKTKSPAPPPACGGGEVGGHQVRTVSAACAPGGPAGSAPGRAAARGRLVGVEEVGDRARRLLGARAADRRAGSRRARAPAARRRRRSRRGRRDGGVPAAVTVRSRRARRCSSYSARAVRRRRRAGDDDAGAAPVDGLEPDERRGLSRERGGDVDAEVRRRECGDGAVPHGQPVLERRHAQHGDEGVADRQDARRR